MILLLAIIIVVLSAIYTYLTWNFDYWKKCGVPHEKPTVLVGNLTDIVLVRKHVYAHHMQLYKQFENEPFCGMYLFRQPALFVKDPQLLKAILVKDFDHFVDRNFHPDEDTDPIAGKSLFSIRGNNWRLLRAKLTPTFTSGKMKRMFQLVAECGDELGSIVAGSAKSGEVVEMKDLCARFTTDVISSCAFGIACHSLQNPDAEFRQMGRKLIEPNLRNTVLGTGLFFFPELIRSLRFTLFPQNLMDFFRSAIFDSVEYRVRNKIKRSDFLQLLLDLKNKGSVDDDDDDVKDEERSENGLHNTSSVNFKLSDDDILAQALTFFNAGFETSSTTMCFTLYELSVNPDIQNKAREEIVSILEKNDNKLSYDSIKEMQYLDLVVSETLRKYPPLPFLDRVCSKDYRIPGSHVVLPKGYPVFIPIMAIHYDPKYYPRPEKFDPERFTEDNKKTRPNYTYFPFGEGPRNCIGSRFGLLQTKVGLASILSRCEVSVCEKTPKPLVLDKRALLLSPVGGLYLQLKPLDN